MQTICTFGGKGQGPYCLPTEARHSLEDGLETDLLQTKVAVPQQAAPKEHPVQTGTVVHDDDAALPRNKAISCYYHLHPEYQLQQRLCQGEWKGWREDGREIAIEQRM